MNSMWRVTLEKSWTSDGSTLHVLESRVDGTVKYLASDGAWETTEPEVQYAPEGAGIFLPWGAAEALIKSLAPESTAGEMGAVREALTVERRRVDTMLNSMLALGSVAR